MAVSSLMKPLDAHFPINKSTRISLGTGNANFSSQTLADCALRSNAQSAAEILT